MDILYRGEAPKENPCIGECDYCHSILREYEANTFQSLILKHKGECPVCHRLVQFYKEGTSDAHRVMRKLARMTEED